MTIDLDDYRVRLEAFEGPLDLLLFLIRRSEVEVTDIPIAEIADQYLELVDQACSVEGFGGLDIDLAGEFLVVAATLMEIKAKVLAGQSRSSAEGDAERPAQDETDPRAELVAQLLEYKRYREAADRLLERREDWSRRAPSGVAGIERDALAEATTRLADEDVEMEDLDVMDLVSAFGQIIAAVDFDRLGEHHVTMDETPLELHAEDIVLFLKEESAQGSAGTVRFARVFEGRTRSEMIGLFLALLELVRRRRVSVAQDDAGGITVGVREPEPDELDASAAIAPTEAEAADDDAGD